MTDGHVSASTVQPTSMTGWVGWIAFAAVVMMVEGSFHIIQGLVAIFRDNVYVVGEQGMVLSINYTAWGWLHIFGGVLLMFSAVFVLVGRPWARAVGVMFALTSAAINFGFLPAFPIWSALMIAIDLLIIWALMVHGDELRREGLA